MLKTRLFQSFAALLLIFGALSAWFGVGVIKNRIITEAQERVQFDLRSAWSVYQAQLRELETVLELTASKKIVGDDALSGRWNDPELRARLELIRQNFGLDFLTLVSADGQVVLRTATPYTRGDQRTEPFVHRALQGKVVKAAELLSARQLELESEGLAERALLALEDTPHARPGSREEESRGLVMLAAAPIQRGPQVLGALYGGILVNRNARLVDEIHDAVYDREVNPEMPRGTATIFLHDSRIATTVRHPNGNRAVGTRASKEVADRVLDNGLSWIGRAFVVRDWYLTAYDPIRDSDGEVIGMLYVGILEKPFRVLGWTIVWRYVGLTLLAVLASLAVAYFLAGRLAQPIHRLAEASRQMQIGVYPEAVSAEGVNAETGSLITAFNSMVGTLKEREVRLNEANENLKAVNASYMETLGFVTHELNTPIASMMNYLHLLQHELIGPLTEKQKKAARILNDNTHRIAEMVRHYLNLSRIEKGELRPSVKPLDVEREVIEPLLEMFEPEIRARRLRVENNIPPATRLRADPNQVREVFENLIGNAIKYGRTGGLFRLSAEPDGDRVRFSVFNEGEGIRPEYLGQLFHKFSRGEEGAAARSRGTGLGLFITRHIVEAHGGWIQAESKPDEWARFVFTLPGENT